MHWTGPKEDLTNPKLAPCGRELARGARACRLYSRAALLGMLLLSFGAIGADLGPVNGLGLRVAPGFVVRQFADPALADDIYSLTINPRGDVVVSGRGYIRTLVDANHDGVAERAIEFGETTTGGMGMCFDGNDLLFVGDGALWRVRDADGDDRADGPAERLIDVPFAEHGGHAIRRGPDGGLYLMVGNESSLPGLSGPAMGSPIEGGALLHLPAGARAAGGFRVLAHGFRNAYDFDFNDEGDVFTYDSDAEADVLLPWHVPTRLFHVAPGGHHGWRLGGWKRSWARPDYSPDTVEILAPLGRGSPTGVVCYRHRQFPEHYRGGIFALDWTFGRLHFAPLSPEGSSYESRPEVFLESAGTTGFAPTDVAVGWDGSLYVSTGGRRSRGAVYRIEYVAEPGSANVATNWMFLAGSELLGVLDAPQPLEEWSRRQWLGVVRRLGPNALVLAASDRRVSVPRRVRAIELLTEQDALAPNIALILARTEVPEVRARIAWSLGVHPGPNASLVLGELARDGVASVRLAALLALRDQSAGLPPAVLEQAVLENLDHSDRRVRQATVLLATWLPAASWSGLMNRMAGLSVPSRLTLTLAHLERRSPDGVDLRAVDWSLSALAGARDEGERLDAVRLLQRGMGEYKLAQPSAEVFTGYEPAFAPDAALSGRIEQALASFFPSGSADLDIELTRTLAMVQAAHPALVTRVVAAIGPRTEAAADLHYLATLARLGARIPTNSMDAVALALVALDRKQQGLASRSKQNWNARLTEVAQRLVERNPTLALALLRQPELVRPGNLVLTPLTGVVRRVACARLFRAAIQRTVGYPWTAELVDLLSALPASDVHPLFRRQLNNPAVRDRIILELAGQPLAGERDYFVAGLASAEARVVRASAEALTRLPRDPAPLVPALRALRRFVLQPPAGDVRTGLLGLISHVTGQKFGPREGVVDVVKAHEHVFAWVAQNFPGSMVQVDADDREGQAKWDQLLQNVPWNRGDAGRGAAVFQHRGCAACHEGSSALGPDLKGVATRLGTNELFHAILYPSREIAPAWRMERFRLRSGEMVTGRVTFESGEALMVQTGIGSTARVEQAEVTSREASELSFMPGGLLTRATPMELADLLAWLKALP